MAQVDWLPLFPLDVVLLPGAALPLHIFEPRYKEMIGECIAQSRPFGVVRAEGQTIAFAGCTAEVTEIFKQYPDGRLDLLAEGRRRFRLREVNNERSFFRADVEYFEDAPTVADSRDIRAVLAAHNEFLLLVESEARLPREADPELSFRLLAQLPPDLDFHQRMLETESEAERVAEMVNHYETLLPKVRAIAYARRAGASNGYVH